MGIAPDDWDDLPWYRQQMYLEGFEAEGLVGDGEGGTAEGDDLFNTPLDSLANSGFSVEGTDEF